MRRITPVEVAHIENDLGKPEVGYIEKLRVKDIPVKEILKNPSFLTLIISGFCQAISDFVIINMLPKYLNYVLEYDLTQNGLLRSALDFT